MFVYASHAKFLYYVIHLINWIYILSKLVLKEYNKWGMKPCPALWNYSTFIKSKYNLILNNNTIPLDFSARGKVGLQRLLIPVLYSCFECIKVIIFMHCKHAQLAIFYYFEKWLLNMTFHTRLIHIASCEGILILCLLEFLLLLTVLNPWHT